jgi:hypothetical protein
VLGLHDLTQVRESEPCQGTRQMRLGLSMRAVWLYHVVRLSQPNVEPLLAERVPLSAWSPRSSPSTPAGWSGIWAAYRHLIKLNKSFDYKCRKRREATRDFTVSVPTWSRCPAPCQVPSNVRICAWKPAPAGERNPDGGVGGGARSPRRLGSANVPVARSGSSRVMGCL